LSLLNAQKQRLQVLEEVQKLRDEIALLKGQKPRPTLTPSRLETPPPGLRLPTGRNDPVPRNGPRRTPSSPPSKCSFPSPTARPEHAPMGTRNTSSRIC